MLRHAIVALIALFAVSAALAQPDAAPDAHVVRYDDYRVARLTVRDLRDLRTLESLGIETLACEVPLDAPIDFLVPPDRYDAFVASGIPHNIVVENLQAVVDAERIRLSGPQPRGASWFDDYKNLAAVEAYMAELAALRPDLVTEINLGNSLEGRPIRGLRISNDAVDLGRCKPAILLNSVQHAREWITVMTNMYVADQLVREYDSDAFIRYLVDNAEFFIIPVVNPDGYAYTWTTQRFWRKNRRPNGGTSFGVDLNRNWGYQWGVTVPGSAGGNASPDSDVYWGTSPFSEPETQRMRDFVLANPQIKAHNDIHSYGQLILWSWGWSPYPIQHQAEWNQIGTQMASLISAVHGRSFIAGPIYSRIYPVSGSSVDWLYGTLGVLSMTYELRGGGFAPPAAEIILSAEETLPATLHQAASMIERFQFISDWNRDCIHDVLDVLDFVSDFDANETRCDLNADAEIDIVDFLEFLQLYSEGR